MHEATLPAAAALALVACSSTPITSVPPEMELGADVFVHHTPGPLAAAGSTGPRRYIEPLLEGFHPDRARPAATLERVAVRLEDLGFGRPGSTVVRVVPEGAPEVLVATLRGSERPDEVIAVLVDLDSPTGEQDAGAVLEGARALLAAVRDRRAVSLEPARSLAFVFGAQPAASLLGALDAAEAALPRAVVVAEALDGPGDLSVPFVLERAPDPGERTPIHPDPTLVSVAEASWEEGAGATALSVMARMALIDVGKVSRPWLTTELQHLGDAPQDPLLARGVPAVRLMHKQPRSPLPSVRGRGASEQVLTPEAERERATVAVVATAVALADAGPDDLERWMNSALLESRLRRNVVTIEANDLDEAGRAALVDEWDRWSAGVREDVRRWCFGVSPRSAAAAQAPEPAAGR